MAKNTNEKNLQIGRYKSLFSKQDSIKGFSEELYQGRRNLSTPLLKVYIQFLSCWPYIGRGSRCCSGVASGRVKSNG